ncbi:HD domain-containing protein [Russula earlei]|uniref:HD domain-containing protein n=1 Tax=Russula earlei TaxID=71964 RepID=A0ACC0UEA7_9AGAM|nr:HD domain-containing protein [Russula earlei]
MTSRRAFPPLYKSSGDTAFDRLAFFHILERLKTQKRTGWVDNNVLISDHMYRMAVLAMCVSDQSLDIAKCVMMALVHDLAEAQVGDIAPREGIPKAEKSRLEAEAMQNFVREMLHDSPAALRIMSLWKEYEDQSTAEARFVKASQALQPFFDSSIPHLRHTEVREWGADLLREREEMWERAGPRNGE